jgi:hypothetical protein
MKLSLEIVGVRESDLNSNTKNIRHYVHDVKALTDQGENSKRGLALRWTDLSFASVAADENKVPPDLHRDKATAL